MKTLKSIKNNWEQIKARLQENYPQLTNEDLNYVEGYENEIFHNLEIKLGMSREQLVTILNSLNVELSVDESESTF